MGNSFGTCGHSIVGVSEIQCIIFKQNNVNPYEIYNICIEINIVLHSRIIFFRKKEY